MIDRTNTPRPATPPPPPPLKPRDPEVKTLRDEFAIAAVPALLNQYARYSEVAKEAYAVADAMLEARNANR